MLCLEAFKKDLDDGGKGLHEDYLVEISGKSFGRVKDIFKSMKGWNNVIKKVKTKTYSLKLKKKPSLLKNRIMFGRATPLHVFQGYLKKMITNGSKLMKSNLKGNNTKYRHVDVTHYKRLALGPYLPPSGDYVELRPVNKKRREKFERLYFRWRKNCFDALTMALSENITKTYESWSRSYNPKKGSFGVDGHSQYLATSIYGGGKKALKTDVDFFKKLLQETKTIHLSDTFLRNPRQIIEYL